jgi:MSHA biogenesis protein MshP
MISAVFILVVLALLGIAITVVIVVQQRSSALDTAAARAYQSAKAGLEWGAFQVLRVPPPPAAAPACFGSTNIAMTGQLAGFTTTISCTSTTATDGGSLTFYRVVANACNIPLGGACPNTSTTSATYAERQLVMTVRR